MVNMQDTFSHVSTSVEAETRRYVDERHRLTGETRDELCIEAGKALVMIGCTFLGNGLGIKDPEQGLQPGRELLKRFEEIAAERSS